MKFGLTQQQPCSYLNDQQEKMLVYVPDQDDIPISDYDKLIQFGFRRSGDQVYRPQCQHCAACQSIRIPVKQFQPSKSQKRVLNKNQDIEITTSHNARPEYYPIYHNYIAARHADGTMYPPTKIQYEGFINSQWMTPLFVEMHFNQNLIGVAVTDQIINGLSAMYTFFYPEYASRSLGTYAILQQIALTASQNKDYLYLGYQVDQCEKMNYKRNFLPHERYLNDKWQLFVKKTA